MSTADLTDEEVDAICHGYVQNAAKVRYLRSLGVSVARKPSGRPLVNRAHYEQVRRAAAGTGKEREAAGAQPAWGVH